MNPKPRTLNPTTMECRHIGIDVHTCQSMSANACGGTQPHTLAYVTPVFLGCMSGRHVATQSRGKLDAIAPCYTQWHTFPLWAMWPRTVGEQYANTWDCIQMHTFAFVSHMLFGHMGQTRKGKVCQCMGCMQWHNFPHTVLGHMA